MDLMVLGINHKTAPVEIREKFSFTEECREGFAAPKVVINPGLIF